MNKTTIMSNSSVESFSTQRPNLVFIMSDNHATDEIRLTENGESRGLSARSDPKHRFEYS